MDPLVIYHANCPDGFCAAWVAYKMFGDQAAYLPVQYGAERDDFDPSICAKRYVYVLDFSFPREKMIEMHALADFLVVLDHHKSAEKDCEGLDFCKFDMERSGAGMVWDYCFDERSRPWLVHYVEDRDLWRWALPDSKAINARVQAADYNFYVWNLLELLGLPLTIAEGKAILSYMDQLVAEIRAQVRLVEFDEYKDVPFVMPPKEVASEVLGALAETSLFSLGCWYRSDGTYEYSLRSRGNFDVSELAKTYGGGGHKNAAGFTRDELIF